MNALTREWVDKAEGDFRTATREARVRKSPNYDARNALSAMKAARDFIRQKLGL